MAFQGVTVHWIEVIDGKWNMRGAVIGFKAISGAHDRENLGRYIVLKVPVLRTACGPENGPNWTETNRTFSPGPCF